MTSNSTIRRASFTAAILAAAVLLATSSHADVFLLKNGGRIAGTWMNADQRPVSTYEIETISGGRLTVAADQVARRIRQSPAELEFERRAPEFGDTAEAQWQLARWCQENKLPAQRRAVLERVIALTPNHVPARHALGYSQVNGRWLRHNEYRKQQGYVYYDGRWRFPQEVEIIEARKKKDLGEKQWRVSLKRWREELGGEKGLQAKQSILTIDHPYAVKPLSELLLEEPYRPVKLLYIEVLGKIGGAAAAEVLIQRSLNDLDEEIRLACIAEIRRLQWPKATETYIKALEDKNNVRVNLAARALRELDDQTAIGPLIDALVTTHAFVIAPKGGQSGDAMSMTFENGGTSNSHVQPPQTGTQMTAGSKTQVFPVTVPNQEVLSALVVISDGVNFSFDKQAWKFWHEAERRHHAPKSIKRAD